MGAPMTPEQIRAADAALKAVPLGRMSAKLARGRQAFRLMQIKMSVMVMMEEAAEHARYCPEAFSMISEWCDDGLKELMQRAQQGAE